MGQKVVSLELNHRSRMAWNKISRRNCNPAVNRGQIKVSEILAVSCLVANGKLNGAIIDNRDTPDIR